jgi:hypothetical protein
VNIGHPRRRYIVEPLEDPVPRDVPRQPSNDPSEDLTAFEKIEAE